MPATTVYASGGNDAPAIQAAAISGATKILLPDGNYNFGSTVNLPAHVDIRGAGRDSTSLTMLLGVDPAWGMLCALNGGYNELSGLSFVGNGVSTLPNATGAVSAHLDASAVAPMGPVGLYECRLSGFQQDNWFYARNDGSQPMSTVTVEANDFRSVIGNSRFYSVSPTGDYMAKFIQAWGGAGAGNPGSISKLVVRRNYFDGAGIAGAGVVAWQNVLDNVVHDNDFENVCQQVTGPANVYVILFYTQGEGSVLNGGGSISLNRIRNAYAGASFYGPACGVYTATTGPVMVANNRISGIVRPDSDNGTLRRAGITINGSLPSIVCGNDLVGCSTGIALCGDVGQLCYPPQSGQMICNNNVFADNGGSDGFNISSTGSSCNLTIALRGNMAIVNRTKVVKVALSPTTTLIDDTL